MKNHPEKSTKTAYNQLAEKYETRWQGYLSHTHEVFLSRLSSGKDEIILDLSCGTGLLASQFLRRGFAFKRLVLNDLSEKMLSIAKERLKENPKISISNHNAAALPFESETFTKIICLNSFHHYSNQPSVVKECHRLLKPRGQLYLLDWNNSGFFTLINFIIKHNSPETINTCSLQHAKQLFSNYSFSIDDEKEWYWKYWKFFFLKVINS